jgi:hypothetical protein
VAHVCLVGTQGQNVCRGVNRTLPNLQRDGVFSQLTPLFRMARFSGDGEKTLQIIPRYASDERIRSTANQSNVALRLYGLH